VFGNVRRTGVPFGAEITPVEPDPVRTGEGSALIPRCLTIAGSDSGGGAGIQADLKAFAAAGCHGMSAIVALTAQNTTGVTAVHEVPPEFVHSQLEAVFDDLGVDAAKTGMLFSAPLIEAAADFLAEHPVPLVVDPVLVASSGARLLREDAVETLVERLFPLATVITPNLPEAQALAGEGSPYRLAERLHQLGAAAVIVTGGHGDEPVDHLFDGEEHVEIPVERHRIRATHGAGCTHSATLTALLARGESLESAARGAARAASRAVAHGLAELGAGEGPVDVLGMRA
jgi:hydroxymethylpyrimidine/phosphomethylpyrimidine kinase